MEFVEESNLLALNKLERLLTVCKVKNIDDIDLSKEFYFIGKTDEEISLVCLADNKIGIFAVSTFNTDYILVKDADFEKSLAVLINAGYTVI